MKRFRVRQIDTYETEIEAESEDAIRQDLHEMGGIASFKTFVDCTFDFKEILPFSSPEDIWEVIWVFEGKEYNEIHRTEEGAKNDRDSINRADPSVNAFYKPRILFE